MPLAVGDAVRIKVFGRCFGQEIVLNLAYRTTVGVANPTDTIMAEILGWIDGGGVGPEIVPKYLACLPPQYSLERTTAQIVSPIRQAYYQSVYVARNGTNANAASVANDAAAITRRTAMAGRSQVSTLKVGPAPDAVSVAGVITDAYRALLQTFGNSTLSPLILPVSTAQLVPTMLSKTDQVSVPPRDLIGARVGIYSRVNRRRTVGIGS